MVNIITINNAVKLFHNQFILFERLLGKNKTFKDILISQNENEFKIRCQSHHPNEIISVLSELKIESKVIADKIPFFVSNLPKHISQETLSQHIQELYPDSRVHVFKSNSKCGKLLIPPDIVNSDQILMSALNSNDGVPIFVPSLKPLYLRPFTPRSHANTSANKLSYSQAARSESQANFVPKPKVNFTNSSQLISNLEAQLNASQANVTHLESKVKSLTSQVNDISLAQGMFDGKFQQLESMVLDLQAKIDTQLALIDTKLTLILDTKLPVLYKHESQNSIVLQPNTPMEVESNDPKSIFETFKSNIIFADKVSVPTVNTSAPEILQQRDNQSVLQANIARMKQQLGIR